LKIATIKREVSTIKRDSTLRMMTSPQMRVMKKIMMEEKSSSYPKKPRMMITRILKKKKSFVKKIQTKKPTLISFGDTKTM
jgi:glutathione synthase/RimK-type ligase-like ATP-grasp enzyme